MKALLESLLDKFHLRYTFVPREWPFLHPGRSAAVTLAAERSPGKDAAADELGFIGELHPLVAAAWDLERAAVFSIDLGKVAGAAPVAVTFRAFASVPALRQDLAVALPGSVPAAEALAAVRSAGGEMLEHVGVFDVYTGEQVAAGRRSLALSLSFRAPDRTLTEEDVAPVRERIVAALRQLGGELRV
jgi:phenylalanyl-tRNA synthetase beta chain